MGRCEVVKSNGERNLLELYSGVDGDGMKIMIGGNLI
jgi:hypothetical protein